MRELTEFCFRGYPTYDPIVLAHARALVTGTDILAPGIVRVEEWRPDGNDGEAPRSFLWSGVGRKP